MALRKLGGGKKPSLTVMVEEVERSIADLPRLDGKWARKSEIEYRQGVLRWVRQSLQYLQEHEEDIRLFARIKHLNPGAMEKLLAFVRAEQALRAAEEAERKDAA